jgi:hypothetical protein
MIIIIHTIIPISDIITKNKPKIKYHYNNDKRNPIYNLHKIKITYKKGISNKGIYNPII